jgi:hypothetical protein
VALAEGLFESAQREGIETNLSAHVQHGEVLAADKIAQPARRHAPHLRNLGER